MISTAKTWAVGCAAAIALQRTPVPALGSRTRWPDSIWASSTIRAARWGGVGKLVEGYGAGEAFSSIAVGVQNADRNLVDLLDVGPSATRRSPAAASAAPLRFSPVGDGAAVLVEHGSLVDDAVLVVPKPTIRAMNHSLMERDANRDCLGYVDKAGGQAAIDAACAFVGRGWVLVFLVMDGHMVKVGNGAGLPFGKSFTAPRLQELLRFGYPRASFV